jgi:hypothetical protein
MPLFPNLEDVIEMRGWIGFYRWYDAKNYPKGRAFRTYFWDACLTVPITRMAASPFSHMGNCIAAAALGPKPLIDVFRSSTLAHLLPVLGRTIPSNVLSLSMTESMKYYMNGQSLRLKGTDEMQSEKSLFTKNFIAGSIGCIIPTILFYPLESSQRHRTIDMGYGMSRYIGVTHCLEQRYIAAEGRILYNGLTASLFGTMMHRGFLFGFYEVGRAVLLTEEQNQTFVNLLQVAVLASAAASAVVAPLDAWRMTFYQTAYHNWMKGYNPWSFITRVRVRTLIGMYPAVIVKSVAPALMLALFTRLKSEPV